MQILNVFVLKEARHEYDKSNASNTASSSHETPPHLRKKNKQITRKNESNHEPNSFSINIEVREDFIHIVNKNNPIILYT